MSGDVDVSFAAAAGSSRGGGSTSGGRIDAGQALEFGSRHERSAGDLDDLQLTGFD